MIMMLFLLASQTLSLPADCMPKLDKIWQEACVQFHVVIELKQDGSISYLKEPPGSISLKVDPIIACGRLQQLLADHTSLIVLLEWKYGKRWYQGTLIAGDQTFDLKIIYE
jgi:hypothetical protein